MLPTLDGLDLQGKRVLVRVDLNVPMQDGIITNDARLKAIIPTLNRLIESGATIILLSHLGRPKSKDDFQYSLEPVAKLLSNLIEREIAFQKDWIDGIDVKAQSINLCENVRYFSGETSNDLGLAKKMASFADIFVMDAFACAHRAHASTTGITNFIEKAVIGPLMEKELNTLSKILRVPEAPVVAIIGGAKVSTKFKVLENILGKVNHLVIGGGMANTFLAAQGYKVGDSLYEPDFIDEAKRLLALADELQVNVILPIDVIIADKFASDANYKVAAIDAVEDNWMILDAGPKSLEPIVECVLNAKTILWNGSLGANEIDIFANGTKTLSESIAKSSAFSIAGGGDTIAAIESFGVSDGIDYISTGGGALLEYLEGIELPALIAIQNSHIS